MILIITSKYDQSTNYVIDWIENSRIDYVRLNIEDTENKVYLEIKGDVVCKIKTKSEIIDLKDISAFWFRRGKLNIDYIIESKVLCQNDGILNHLKNEIRTLENFVAFLLSNKHSLGNYHQGNANKLISLKMAIECGLNVPETLVSSEKNEVNEFFGNYKECITKGVQDVLSIIHGDTSMYYATELVLKEDVANLSHFFFPTLLQEKVEKLYELRIFYISGKFYSMAIFSQEDEQTKIDFRNYNEELPNRNVPYKLPTKIEKQLDAFMKKMNLDTGSIDMIVNTDYDYVFLEVNPVGQYDMVSVPCNYYLHEKIAKYLTLNTKNER